MVFWSNALLYQRLSLNHSWQPYSCIPLYPVPEYPMSTATFFFGLLSSAAISSLENSVA